MSDTDWQDCVASLGGEGTEGKKGRDSVLTTMLRAAQLALRHEARRGRLIGRAFAWSPGTLSSGNG